MGMPHLSALNPQRPSKPGFIQIAGVIDRAEANLLAQSGVEYLGFPLRLDVHTPDLSEKEAASVIDSLPPRVHAVLITYLDEAEPVLELCRQLRCFAVQLHGPMHPSELAQLRSKAPEIEIIKSLIVRHRHSTHDLIESMNLWSPHVDAFITDTFDPATGASGATGKTHDWNVSRRLVELSERPVILAGGLKPGNVREAIRFVRPAGVDVHTGVENEHGRKDPLHVKQFVAEARAAFYSLAGTRARGRLPLA